MLPRRYRRLLVLFLLNPKLSVGRQPDSLFVLDLVTRVRHVFVVFQLGQCVALELVGLRQHNLRKILLTVHLGRDFEVFRCLDAASVVRSRLTHLENPWFASLSRGVGLRIDSVGVAEEVLLQIGVFCARRFKEDLLLHDEVNECRLRSAIGVMGAHRGRHSQVLAKWVGTSLGFFVLE